MAGLLEPFVKQLGDGEDPLACAAGLQLLADLLEKVHSNAAAASIVARLAEPAILQAAQSIDASVQCQALKARPASRKHCLKVA